MEELRIFKNRYLYMLNQIWMSMNQYIESKAVLVKKKIEEDFKETNEHELEKFFDKFQDDKRVLSFLKYYNKTVLDKTQIKFSEFKYQWALHLTKRFYTSFHQFYYLLFFINFIDGKTRNYIFKFFPFCM